MPKFKKPSQYPQREAAITGPVETPEVKPPAEDSVIVPQEQPIVHVCPINGCGTRYTDAAIMDKHLKRQHGIGNVENILKPKPRDPNSLGDPELKRARERGEL